MASASAGELAVRQASAKLSRGEPVLWRKLWNGAVMTALPMRVVSDTAERTVLYLAPETRFKGARTPAGNKVRDFSNWVSKDLVWAGGSLIRLAEPGVWHCVDVEFDETGEFIGWYVNFQQPIQRARCRFDTVDLVLDLVVAPDRRWRLKDEGDFRQAVADGYLTAGTESRVRAEADQVISVLAAGGPPFCESEWLSWRPPADWTVPALPEDWAH
jgi:Protein of unknown function (DUF402)